MAKRDPLGFNPDDAPLWKAYRDDKRSIRKSFAIPGHKNRKDLVGKLVAHDRPVVLNNDVSVPSLGSIRLAEQLAARAWGAEHARFSVNGSSAANQATMMAVAGPGDTVIVSRTLHKSLLFGLINSGAIPLWVRPDFDEETGLPMGVPACRICSMLITHPQAKAVFVGEPSYIGTFGDIASQAVTCHEFDKPLVVDAAWAAHYGFHPDLPRSPMQQGADAMVTSAHKTLPAFTQAAILLSNSERIDQARLNRAFDGTQTTSPSAPILASIDAARALLEARGQVMLDEAIHGVSEARAILREVPGLRVMEGENVDPLKLVLFLPHTGTDGSVIHCDLRAEGLEVEMATRDLLIPQVTLADRRQDIVELAAVLARLIEKHRGVPRDVPRVNSWQVDPVMALTPREAFYMPNRMVSWGEAEGRVSAELVSPYPPGIPVLAPGEVITRDVLDVLNAAKDSGVHIAYASDPTLASLCVVTD